MYKTTLAAFAATTVLFAGSAMAQQPVDWDKIQIKTTDLGNKTYMLEGQGGNITVAVGTDGIIMVDTQFAPLSDKIKAAVKAISPLRSSTSSTPTSTATTPAATPTSRRTAPSSSRRTTSGSACSPAPPTAPPATRPHRCRATRSRRRPTPAA